MVPCHYIDGRIREHDVDERASIYLRFREEGEAHDLDHPGGFDGLDLIRLRDKITFHRVSLAYPPDFIGPWERDHYFEADHYEEAINLAEFYFAMRGRS